MLNKEQHQKAARQFCGKDCCYIHTEMKNGKHCETVLAGDGAAILHGICGEIHRAAQLGGMTFDETLGIIKEMHEAATITEG